MDYLSFFFNKDWKMPMTDIVSIIIKLADENKGSTDGRHIDKTMSVNDHRNMGKAVSLCMDIVEQLGVPKEEQFLRTLNAGHPGGMLPLDEHSAKTLHDSSLACQSICGRCDHPANGNGQSADSHNHGAGKENRNTRLKNTGPADLPVLFFVFRCYCFSAALSVKTACLRLCEC